MTEQTYVPSINTVNIWGLGGTGIDVVRAAKTIATADDLSPVMPNINYAFVDTSDSNMENLDINEVYRLKGLKRGGGKDRELVKREARPVMPEILQQFGDADLHIVVAGISGGTGSGLLVSLLGNLLTNGANVALVLLSDETSTVSTTNAINTMADLEQLATHEQIRQDLTIALSTNDPKQSHAENDGPAIATVLALAEYASGTNKRLDIEDVRNLLCISNTTHHEIGLNELVVTTDPNVLTNLPNIAGLGAVMKSEDSVLPELEIDYDAIGYATIDPVSSGRDKDIFLAVVPGLTGAVDRLIEARDRIAKKNNVQVQRSSLSSTEVKGNFNGGSGVSW